MKCIHIVLSFVAYIAATNSLYAHEYPWSPEIECELNEYSPVGLIPPMEKSLNDISLTHRITQGFNSSVKASNYHGSDYELHGTSYSSAVDLSIRCLTDEHIKFLLGELASRGFAAWLRRNGEDGWRGQAHIHAIWVLGKLKPQLDSQVKDWLAGRNGLVSDLPYEFWLPNSDQLLAIEAAYGQ